MKFEIGIDVIYKHNRYSIISRYAGQDGAKDIYKIIPYDKMFINTFAEENELTPVIKKWEPKGGEWAIQLDIDVYKDFVSKEFRLAGLTRENFDEANIAHDRLRKFSRLSAWIDEFSPDSKFKLVYSDFYSVGFVFECSFPSVIEKLKEDIKSGVVEL